MSASLYATVKKAIADGEIVSQANLDTANAYAKRAKRGQLRLPDTAPPKKAAPAKKVTPARAARGEAPAVCTDKACDKPAIAKGLCTAHYAQARRSDPAEREKANQASREYYARRAAKAAKAKA